jgi:hypothetical protein
MWAFEVHVAEDDAMNDIIQVWLRTALLCALFFISSGDSSMAFLSEPADDVKQPTEETPRSVPEENKNFDGAWIFTSAGCRGTGSLPAMIVGGKIVIRGGSGQVDPDGTLHSVGAGNGMTLTAAGRLSGNTGAGTFNRSDGCVGSWIAIKR